MITASDANASSGVRARRNASGISLVKLSDGTDSGEVFVEATVCSTAELYPHAEIAMHVKIAKHTGRLMNSVLALTVRLLYVDLIHTLLSFPKEGARL
jgi:hypothetical protein